MGRARIVVRRAHPVGRSATVAEGSYISFGSLPWLSFWPVLKSAAAGLLLSLMRRARTVVHRVQPVKGLTHVAHREHSLVRATKQDWLVRNPEAATVPGLTRGRNLHSER